MKKLVGKPRFRVGLRALMDRMARLTGSALGMDAKSKPCIQLYIMADCSNLPLPLVGNACLEKLQACTATRMKLARRQLIIFDACHYFEMESSGLHCGKSWSIAQTESRCKTQINGYNTNEAFFALWLVGCKYEDTPIGWQVSQAWDPLLEAHPERQQLEGRSEQRVSRSVGAEESSKSRPFPKSSI